MSELDSVSDDEVVARLKRSATTPWERRLLEIIVTARGNLATASSSLGVATAEVRRLRADIARLEAQARATAQTDDEGEA